MRTIMGVVTVLPTPAVGKQHRGYEEHHEANHGDVH